MNVNDLDVCILNETVHFFIFYFTKSKKMEVLRLLNNQHHKPCPRKMLLQVSVINSLKGSVIFLSFITSINLWINSKSNNFMK